MNEILEFLKDNPVFYVATVENGSPRVRPFGLVFPFEGKLFFGVGSHKASYRQLKENPNIEICTADAKGMWIRIRGKAVFDERAEAAGTAFETMPMLHKIYNEKTGFKLAPFYIAEGQAEFADMKGFFKSIEF